MNENEINIVFNNRGDKFKVSDGKLWCQKKGGAPWLPDPAGTRKEEKYEYILKLDALNDNQLLKKTQHGYYVSSDGYNNWTAKPVLNEEGPSGDIRQIKIEKFAEKHFKTSLIQSNQAPPQKR